MSLDGHIDLTQATSIITDFTTKADERFIKINDMTNATETEIAELKTSIWPAFNEYTSSSIIPWNEFENALLTNQFVNNVVGAQVTDINGHNWRIIQNNGDSYDLWYQQGLPTLMAFNDELDPKDDDSALWSKSTVRKNINSDSFYNNESLLPNDLKSRIIQKTNYSSGNNKELDTSIDYIWILSVTELGLGNVANNGTKYNYFDSNSKRIVTANSRVVLTRTAHYSVSSTDKKKMYCFINNTGTIANFGIMQETDANIYSIIPCVRVR